MNRWRLNRKQFMLKYTYPSSMDLPDAKDAWSQIKNLSVWGKNIHRIAEQLVISIPEERVILCYLSCQPYKRFDFKNCKHRFRLSFETFEELLQVENFEDFIKILVLNHNYGTAPFTVFGTPLLLSQLPKTSSWDVDYQVLSQWEGRNVLSGVISNSDFPSSELAQYKEKLHPEFQVHLSHLEQAVEDERRIRVDCEDYIALLEQELKNAKVIIEELSIARDRKRRKSASLERMVLNKRKAPREMLLDYEDLVQMQRNRIVKEEFFQDLSPIKAEG